MGASNTIVIGIGNPGRGDDGAGVAVIARLRGTLPDGIALAESSGEATALVSLFEGVSRAVLVDACQSAAAPGTIHRFDAAESPLPQRPGWASTHGFGAAAAIELARALGQLPPNCIVYAIEGRAFEPGAPLSETVRAAVDDAATRVREDVSQQCAFDAGP
jgi:hydrogenase maturation protease